MERKLKQNYKFFTKDDPTAQDFKLLEEYLEMLASHMLLSQHNTKDNLLSSVEETLDYLSILLQKGICEHGLKYKDMMGMLPFKVNRTSDIVQVMKEDKTLTYDEAKERVWLTYRNTIK